MEPGKSESEPPWKSVVETLQSIVLSTIVEYEEPLGKMKKNLELLEEPPARGPIKKNREGGFAELLTSGDPYIYNVL